MKELSFTIANALNASIESRGLAGIAFPGGRSPVPLFEVLRERDVQWNKVDVTLVDERWLAADNPQSNAYLLNTHFFLATVTAANFIPLAGDEPTPEEGLTAARQRLEALQWPLDCVVLGIGPDGHFASLFPFMSGIEDALDPATKGRLVPTTKLGDPPLARISLTLPAILDTRHLFLLAEGQEKQDTVRRALQEGSVAEFPLRALMSQKQRLVTIVPPLA